MKNSSLATVIAACLLSCLAGCHHQEPAEKYLEFTITPTAATKTVALQCVGSSTGKCTFAFAAAQPGQLSVDVGANATVTGTVPGDKYCGGITPLTIDKCHQGPIPDHQATVKKQSHSN